MAKGKTARPDELPSNNDKGTTSRIVRLVEEDMKRQLGRVVALIDEVDPTRPQDITVGMPVGVKSLRQEAGESGRTMLAVAPA